MTEHIEQSGAGNTEVIPAADAQGNMTMKVSDLQAIVAAAVKAATSDTTSMLAQALLDSRKPYVDPKQHQNDEFMKAQMRKASARIDREREAAKTNCPHKQGCNPLSDFESTKSAFAVHQLDTGEVIGICTNCGKIISSLIPEERAMLATKRGGGNRPSMAGQRVFIDPLAAQRARVDSVRSAEQVVREEPSVEEDDKDFSDLIHSQPVL